MAPLAGMVLKIKEVWKALMYSRYSINVSYYFILALNMSSLPHIPCLLTSACLLDETLLTPLPYSPEPLPSCPSRGNNLIRLGFPPCEVLKGWEEPLPQKSMDLRS